MKTLLLVLVLLLNTTDIYAANSLRALLFNSRCVPENSLNDGSGLGNNASAGANTIVYSNALKMEGDYSASGFATCCSTIGGTLYSDMTNASVTVQTLWRATSLADNPTVPLSFSRNDGQYGTGIRVNSNGSVSLWAFATVTTTAVGTVTTNQWYYMAMHTGAGGNKLFISAIPGTISNVPIVTTGTAQPSLTLS